MATASPSIRTLADLMKRLGDVPLDRIRFHPAPGTAIVADVDRIQQREGRLCELVEGVLLEKTMGMRESRLAMYLGGLLDAFVLPRNLGIVAGADGTMQIVANLVRIPDVAFIAWDRFPNRKLPDEPIPLVAPNLAVEVLSASNTPAEMSIKRREYFEAGVLIVWEIDPRKRTVSVYTSATQSVTLSGDDTLDGGTVLPGFKLPLAHLFADLDRRG
jgi:Uma2 family endonuclease